jgi:transcriptional regulator with XRE-family HTH domain
MIDSLWQQIGSALRARRAELGLSQRELAVNVGVSQSTLARLEAASGQSSVTAAVQVLAAVGVQLSVGEAATPTRMAGEHVRDRSGRRLPAHLTAYRLSTPHSWWAGTTDARMWRDEPRWSFRRR